MTEVARSRGDISRARVVDTARCWVGTPYHHQASLRGVGTDCLGLVQGVFRELYGADAEQPPPYTHDWAEASGSETLLIAASRHLCPIPSDDLQPGDVLIFRYRATTPAKHCGILASPTTFIHASEGAPVTEVALQAWWRRRIAGVFSFPGISD